MLFSLHHTLIHSVQYSLSVMRSTENKPVFLTLGTLSNLQSLIHIQHIVPAHYTLQLLEISALNSTC